MMWTAIRPTLTRDGCDFANTFTSSIHLAMTTIMTRLVDRWLLLVCCLLFASTSSAINITMNFTSGASDSPSFDSSHSGLKSLFNYAASYYEGVFKDTSHNITINYWYDDLSNANGTLGSHSMQSQGGSPSRETVADIRIDSQPTLWYIDSTPGSNSEFTMRQTLWRDLTAQSETTTTTTGQASRIRLKLDTPERPSLAVLQSAVTTC